MHSQHQSLFDKPKFRVLLVDDHPIVRIGLTQLINHEPDLVVCGEAEDAPTAFEAICRMQPNIAIIDISLKRGNGLELVKNVKACLPNQAMIVLSMHDE